MNKSTPFIMSTYSGVGVSIGRGTTVDFSEDSALPPFNDVAKLSLHTDGGSGATLELDQGADMGTAGTHPNSAIQYSLFQYGEGSVGARSALHEGSSLQFPAESFSVLWPNSGVSSLDVSSLVSPDFGDALCHWGCVLSQTKPGTFFTYDTSGTGNLVLYAWDTVTDNATAQTARLQGVTVTGYTYCTAL